MRPKTNHNYVRLCYFPDLIELLLGTYYRILENKVLDENELSMSE